MCRVILSCYIYCQPGEKKVLFVSSLSLATAAFRLSIHHCSFHIAGFQFVNIKLEMFWKQTQTLWIEKSLKPQTPEGFSHAVQIWPEGKKQFYLLDFSFGVVLTVRMWSQVDSNPVGNIKIMSVNSVTFEDHRGKIICSDWTSIRENTPAVVRRDESVANYPPETFSPSRVIFPFRHFFLIYLVFIHDVLLKRKMQ